VAGVLRVAALFYSLTESAEPLKVPGSRPFVLEYTKPKEVLPLISEIAFKKEVMKTEHWSNRGAAERYAKGRPQYQHQVIRRVREFLKIQGQLPRALDVACGTGLSSIALKEIAQRIAACDVAHDMVSVATSDPQVDYLIARAEATPFATACFDLVTVSSAFHWFDFDRFRRELIRVLRPGGYAVVYSLIGSAKPCGVEPRAYLREATLRAVRNPGTATLARDLKSSESQEKTAV